MQQAVGQRRFPMVNMGDDAEISNVCCVHLSGEKTYAISRRRKGNKSEA
jgi:hypothetical protein